MRINRVQKKRKILRRERYVKKDARTIEKCRWIRKDYRVIISCCFVGRFLSGLLTGKSGAYRKDTALPC